MPKSTPAQLRAAKTYRLKKRNAINDHMVEYYERNRDEILRKKREYYQRKKLARQNTNICDAKSDDHEN